MRLKPDQIPSHLARGLAPLYVVGGDEPLLVQEVLDAIRAAARKAGYSEREVLDVDRYFNWQALADSCASLSLFASKRIVEVRLSGSGPGDGADVLIALAQRPPPDTLLLVACGPLDWRARKAAWYAGLEAAGAGVYCEPIKGAAYGTWLEDRLRTAGLKVHPDALDLLAQRTEGNLLAAAQDIEKLKLLFPGATVTPAELDAAVADSARFESFDLTDRMLEGDAAGAVRSLARLREEGFALLEILGAVAWTLRSLTRAALALPRVGDPAVACDQAGVRRDKQSLFIKALHRTNRKTALTWMQRMAAIDEAAKTGGEAAGWEELLTLVLAASGAAGKKAA